MSDAVQTQLMILVERAVRPVRGSISRKRKMREELLGHVTAVFAEESATLGDENAALERTKARFGNPAELTEQMERALPNGERRVWAWETWAFPPGKSSLYFALRNVLLFLPIPLFMLVVFIPTLLYVHSRGLSDRSLTDDVLFLLLNSGIAHALMCSLIFFTTLMVHGVRRAIHGPGERSWLRAGLIAAVAALLTPIVMFVVLLRASGDLVFSFSEFVSTSPLYAVVPFLLAILTFMDGRWIRFDREWASLPIDGMKGNAVEGFPRSFPA